MTPGEFSKAVLTLLTNFELLRLKRQFYRPVRKKGQRGGSEECRKIETLQTR